MEIVDIVEMVDSVHGVILVVKFGFSWGWKAFNA